MSDHFVSSSAPHARPVLRVCAGDFPALFSEGMEPETEAVAGSLAEPGRLLPMAWLAIFSRLAGRVRALRLHEQQG